MRSWSTILLYLIASVAVMTASLRRVALAQSCQEAPVNLILQEEATGQVPELFAGMVGRGDIDDISEEANLLEVFVPAGQVGETTVYAAIVSQLAGEGAVQAWSLACEVRGDVELVDATSSGLVGELEPFFEVVMPHHGALGVVTSQVVLSGIEVKTLAEQGTATVLAMTVRTPEPMPAEGGEGFRGTIVWQDGLGYIPIPNFAAARGTLSLPFCRTQNIAIHFRLSDAPLLRRCDSNDDGGLGIADAIWLLREIFGLGPPSDCDDAADCDDNGVKELTDAIFVLSALFLGTARPPEPFSSCGVDSTDDDLGCARYDSCP